MANSQYIPNFYESACFEVLCLFANSLILLGSSDTQRQAKTYVEGSNPSLTAIFSTVLSARYKFLPLPHPNKFPTFNFNSALLGLCSPSFYLRAPPIKPYLEHVVKSHRPDNRYFIDLSIT